jgi:hypothetical protein
MKQKANTGMFGLRAKACPEVLNPEISVLGS